ncbi:hypothetical protein CDV36_014865 [Fusarium kuroshium]|uniref:Uncharacterized protein n=2 Tax=Fusarium solani species complex TaxID=232080 RepID=A0A3M2RE71_9HYPO|nr:hypothetical protein CDV36_014865 [Fusarium kuroshium]RSL81291.1 hypothetical protein CEP51_005967 [Fusarium floridanum]
MYLKAPVPRGWDTPDGLRPRAQDDSKRADDGGNNTVVFIVIASAVAFTVAVACWIFISKRKKKTKTTENKKPGFFARITGRSGQGNYEQTAGDDGESGRNSHQLDSTSSSGRRNRDSASSRNSQANRSGNTSATVDRNTSVRSVLTLPAYRQMANPNEQVLGREGERDGVDVIIDLPTAEEEEEARDNEMETLYQIRLARRQMLAEREDRRERRREARTRNDYRTLEQIRAETRLANENTTISELRSTVDQIKENRNRSVSSVSYADVGIARHDGTRIRANSTESERVGLLSDAASLGHQRGRSGSSAVSHEDDFSSLAPARSRGSSRAGTPNDDGRAGSSPELVEADLGDETMPPPEYEDIPLNDDMRSTTPINEPPPDYPGPYRSSSQRTQRTAERDLGSGTQNGEVGPAEQAGAGHDGSDSHNSPRGRDGAPQLPSLRISQLPEIVIEPSSAHPRDNDQRSLR